MKRKKYVRPQIEVVEIENEQIICQSGDTQPYGYEEIDPWI